MVVSSTTPSYLTLAPTLVIITTLTTTVGSHVLAAPSGSTDDHEVIPVSAEEVAAPPSDLGPCLQDERLTVTVHGDILSGGVIRRHDLTVARSSDMYHGLLAEIQNLGLLPSVTDSERVAVVFASQCVSSSPLLLVSKDDARRFFTVVRDVGFGLKDVVHNYPTQLREEAFDELQHCVDGIFGHGELGISLDDFEDRITNTLGPCADAPHSRC